MPSLALVAPVALPLVAAGLTAALGLGGLKAGRAIVGAGAWGALLAPWLALSWAGVILQVVGGTAVYAAVPVSALTVPVFLLLALAALMASGLFPWRGWPAQLWLRPSLRAAGMAIATLYPLGFYLLVRAYEMGDGRYPQPILGVSLACLGVLVALGVAVRAQAAPTRRRYLGEVIPGLGGFALMAIAIGTPVGLVAGIVLLITIGVLTACLPLLP